jgi:hypothetical protein
MPLIKFMDQPKLQSLRELAWDRMRLVGEAMGAFEKFVDFQNPNFPNPWRNSSVLGVRWLLALRRSCRRVRGTLSQLSRREGFYAHAQKCHTDCFANAVLSGFNGVGAGRFPPGCEPVG